MRLTLSCVFVCIMGEKRRQDVPGISVSVENRMYTNVGGQKDRTQHVSRSRNKRITRVRIY